MTGSAGSAPQTRPSLVRRIRDWAAWEFDRSIEVTPAIKFIIAERFTKATILILGGLALVVFGHKTNIHQLAENLQVQLNLSPGRGWWRHVAMVLLSKLGNLSMKKEVLIGVGAILYGLLEAVEGTGLVLRRRWAEYLVLVATAVFLPLEIDELFHRQTVFKAAAFLINVLICVYLVWRKRLFLERPSHERADETEPVPGDLLHAPPSNARNPG